MLRLCRFLFQIISAITWYHSDFPPVSWLGMLCSSLAPLPLLLLLLATNNQGELSSAQFSSAPEDQKRWCEMKQSGWYSIGSTFYVPGPLRANPRILFHGQLFTLYNIRSQTVTQKCQIGTILACFSAHWRVSRQPVVHSSNIPARWHCVDVANQTKYISQKESYQSTAGRCIRYYTQWMELDGNMKQSYW